MTTSPIFADVAEGELPKLEAIISALKCEQTGHIMEAILLYEESIFKLSQMAEAEPSRRQLCGKYLKMYESRAKQLRDQVKGHLHSSRMLDHITIEQGARGRSYQRLFGPYLDDGVREAHLNEPHLTEPPHFRNLLMPPPASTAKFSICIFGTFHGAYCCTTKQRTSGKTNTSNRTNSFVTQFKARR